MQSPPSVNIARLLYILICVLAGFMFAFGTRRSDLTWEVPVWVGVMIGLLVAGFFILVEALIKGFSLRGFSSATFGLLVGLFCAFLLTKVGLSDLATDFFERMIVNEWGLVGGTSVAERINLAMGTMLFAGFGFIGAVLALRSGRDDFAFILPYVRFRQDGTTGQPIVLDADSIMDGRIAGLVRSGFVSGRLVVPRFILDAIQAKSEAPHQAERQHATRGLELLEKLQADRNVAITVEDVSEASKEETTQARLVQASLLLGARLLTIDETLAKFARLRGVDVLSLPELSEALRPAVVVGQRMRLALVRPGKDDHQAVGYLSDGTMIVVNHAVQKIGETADVEVISTLQTSGGTMVFAELAA